MNKHAFSPDFVVWPGKTLAETLEKTGMSQSHLAERTGLSLKTINEIINGSEPIAPDTAIQFEKVFRVPARFWLNLQKNYEEHTARLLATQVYAQSVGRDARHHPQREFRVDDCIRRGV